MVSTSLKDMETTTYRFYWIQIKNKASCLCNTWPTDTGPGAQWPMNCTKEETSDMYTYICIITSYLQTYAYSTSFKPMHPSCQCIFGTWLVAQYCWSCLNSLPWSAAFQPLFAWLYKSSYDMYIQQTTARFGPPVGLSADLLHWIGNRPSISAQDYKTWTCALKHIKSFCDPFYLVGGINPFEKY